MDWLDLFFPKKCVGCGEWGKYVCEKCEVGLWEEEQICPVCGRNSRYGVRHKYCVGSMEGLVCLWAYEGIARRLITKSKYYFYYDHLQAFSIFNTQYLLRNEFYYFNKFLETGPTVVPVPLHHNKEKERGFNQATLVARSLAEEYSLPLDSRMLLRTRDTGRQVGRTREERLRALEGAFRIKKELSFDLTRDSQNFMRVLLVDDVWTTGATMRECAKVLRQAGVKQMWGLVLAR